LSLQDLALALLLALPPWLGFLTYRYKGRVGLSYGYFLGGILTILSIPWPQLGHRGIPSAHLGGALLGFTFFLQAHREGRNGLRRLAIGVGGATLFAWTMGTLLDLNMRSVPTFWGTALLEGSLWLLLSDLGYRLTRGRWLSLRMPMAGGAAFLAATVIYRLLPLGTPPLSWGASLLAGVLLGLVALHQLTWLRAQGIWVEGRGDGFRTALSALEGDKPAEGPTLAYAIEARQPMLLVNEKGILLETNTAFSRIVGLPRHQMKGFQVHDLFQGVDTPTWETLRAQLLQDSRGSAQATLVRRDSSFQGVRLEAVAFDRNMALVWIADSAPGTLALREEGLAPLSALVPAEDRPAFAGLRALPALQALVPHLRRIFPAEFEPALRADPATLLLEEETLRRLAIHLALHGRQGLGSGKVTLVLENLDLGGRPWASLSLELAGPPQPWEGDLLGLSWLHRTVQEASGLLELDAGPGGFLLPRILLPRREDNPGGQEGPLANRSVWILHQDPGIVRMLSEAVAAAGGVPTPFTGLRALIEAARGGALPDLLTLQRTRTLERFQGRLARLRGRAVPTLLLDDGRPLPQTQWPGGRLLILEKPYSGANFRSAIHALLPPPDPHAS
jgi:PAS domain-containing protein